MSEPFNPYVEWLGIPSGKRPANHYELLGIDIFESDPGGISRAADALISRIRRVRPGQNVAQWQQLLDEVKAVKACLLDSASKNAYDADLRRQTGPSQPAAAALPGYPSPPPGSPVPALPPGYGTQPQAVPAWNYPQVLTGPQTPGVQSPTPQGFAPSGPSGGTVSFPGTGPNPGASPGNLAAQYLGPSAPQPGNWPPAPVPYPGTNPPAPVNQGPSAAPVPAQGWPAPSWPAPPQSPAQPNPYPPTGMPFQSPAQPNPYPPTGMSPQPVPSSQPINPGGAGGQYGWRDVPVGTPVPVGSVAGTPTPVPAAAIPVGVPVSPSQGDFAGGFAGEGIASPRKESRRDLPAKSALPTVLAEIALILMLVVGAGLAFVLYRERQKERTAASRPAAVKHDAEASETDTIAQSPASEEPGSSRRKKSSRKPKPTAAERTQPREKPSQTSKPDEKTKPEEKPKEETAKPEQKPAATDPAKQRAMNQSLGEARVSLSEFDVDAARKHLETAARNAQGPADGDQVERLRTLANYVEEFWKNMGRIVAGLEATEEIAIGEERIVVVESSADRLLIKAQGRMRQYTPLEQMPYVLVTALADHKFAKDAASRAVYGAYLAVAPDGDRQRARQLWQEASQAGVKMDDLLPELDQARPAPGAPGVQKVEPPTDKAALEQTARAIRERFKADYDQATTPAGKSELAKRLLQAGRADSDDPDIRFVMLREARDLAVGSGDPGLACAAIDQLAKLYTVDPVEMKAAALEEVGKSARGLNSHKEIAQSTLPLIEAAMKANRLEEAKRLADLAASAAQKAKSTALLRQIRAITQELESHQKGKKPEGQKGE